MRIQMGHRGEGQSRRQADRRRSALHALGAVADFYAPIRQGTDIAFLLGVIRYCMENDKVQWDYVKAFTNAPYLVKEGFGYADGLFTGYDETRRDYDRSTWDYELGEDGYVVADETLEHPRCVWQLLQEARAVYTPEMVERICGRQRINT